jgi:hypothetical protein
VTLDIRPTDDPDRFDLYENDDRIGEIVNEPLDEEGVALGEPPFWTLQLWSLMGTRKEWHANGESLDEVKQYAHEMYKEFVAERRQVNQPGPGPRVRLISTPTGGQRRPRR